jgi:hypothetical protein
VIPIFIMVKSMAMEARVAQKATHKKIGTPRIKKTPVTMEMIQIATSSGIPNILFP